MKPEKHWQYPLLFSCPYPLHVCLAAAEWLLPLLLPLLLLPVDEEPEEPVDELLALHVGMLAEVISELLPGVEIRVVRSGVLPSVHVQQGSPSSSPLDCPSPSESDSQSDFVHV